MEKEKAKHRGWVLEKVYYVFFFNNILLMWKIVGASKVSVLYIYIYIDDLLVGFLFVFMTKFDIKGETES